jgi:hypothetical protein
VRPLFNLESLDVKGDYKLKILGYRNGVLVKTQWVNLTAVWQTITLTGFERLSNVNFQAYGAGNRTDIGGACIDNVCTTPTPEPLTLTLLAAGGAAVAARRRLG